MDAYTLRRHVSALLMRPVDLGTEWHHSIPETHLKLQRGHNRLIATISGTFNSLSKVLSTFPSRYLFAIVFGEVFSLGWNLPPD